MALTSLSSRVQILPTTSPAVVRPSKRVVQVTAKQDMPHRLVSRSGMAAAAAAILLTASPVFAQSSSPQMVADLAEQGFGNLKPEARDDTRGLPLSDTRYPEGAQIAGDETKIRDARKQLDEEIINDKAKDGDFSKTGTLLDPYGMEPSKYPKAAAK